MDKLEQHTPLDSGQGGPSAYWDEDSYVRIDRAAYDAGTGHLLVWFRDGDEIQLRAQYLVRPEETAVQWDRLEVIDHYYLHVPAHPEPIDIPGFTIRSITDPVFAAHLARKAEESARAVGAKVKRLRTARGFTTQQVAERVDMPQQSISRIEQGRHAVSYPTLKKILAAMGYTLDDLLPAEPLAPAPQR